MRSSAPYGEGKKGKIELLNQRPLSLDQGLGSGEGSRNGDGLQGEVAQVEASRHFRHIDFGNQQRLKCMVSPLSFRLRSYRAGSDIRASLSDPDAELLCLLLFRALKERGVELSELFFAQPLD